ncbi:hypothetical protein AOQ84DRAFT_90032 [Glonium stellatum]|uniref:Uncharacterized protein n=1 Tax=Glonium stellatum TaxID=574774 RepID=A0A8E2EVW0_9PEZI|nr:hypothetical protein AOQ84DRAFT_90032 [Glonium stellatum]
MPAPRFLLPESIYLKNPKQMLRYPTQSLMETTRQFHGRLLVILAVLCVNVLYVHIEYVSIFWRALNLINLILLHQPTSLACVSLYNTA